jgi:hypothetical protein
MEWVSGAGLVRRVGGTAEVEVLEWVVEVSRCAKEGLVDYLRKPLVEELWVGHSIHEAPRRQGREEDRTLSSRIAH